jgi:hypothetical protein
MVATRAAGRGDDGAAGLAGWLHARRDYGSALWSVRAPQGVDEDLHPWGLVWRLQRGVVLGWSAALFLVGLGYGTLTRVGRQGGRRLRLSRSRRRNLPAPLVRDRFPAVAMVVVARSHIDGGDGRAIDVLLALRGRSRAQVCQVSRANADDRLSHKPLGGVEGCDGIVEGCGGSDVRAQPSVPHPLHDLTQLSAIGLDNEIHC